jgi:membrane protease subunit HflK
MAENPWGKRPTSGGGNSGGGGGFGGGKRPGTPGGGENPFEKLIRDSQAKMREAIKKKGAGGGGTPDNFNEKKVIGFALAAILLLWLASGIYRVNSDELGVVLRFGEYHRTTTPGLNYHLPSPIEKVIIPSVTTINKVEIGRRAAGAENPNVRVAKAYNSAAEMVGASPTTEGLMLTGDRNLVDVDFEVQWKIDATAPEKFLFNMRNPAGNVKYVAESAMREIVGRNTLDDVINNAQGKITEDARKLIQQTLREYNAGIEITLVNVSRPDVPQPVIGEFQDVKRAEQDKQTAESVAEGYRNEIIPRAKGDAAKMLQDAEGYKSRVIADATGSASRFKQVYAEYAQAKDVTKRRMYLETMEEVLRGMPKVIMDSKSGPVPVLPLSMPAARGSSATTNLTAVPTMENAPASR